MLKSTLIKQLHTNTNVDIRLAAPATSKPRSLFQAAVVKKPSTRLVVCASSSIQPTTINEAEEDDYIALPEPQHIILNEEFSPELIPQLRQHFDTVFADPLDLNSDRFCWDYWHVPDQYTALRTPSVDFFPRKLYNQLEDELIAFGEQQLGCRGISPIWLSNYVDGCFQEFHTDSPHGPWAFVLSLTNWDDREFTGGETKLLQPHVTTYWREFNPDQGLETPQLIAKIPPYFGRLTIFDPRLPHGVQTVEGTKDPRKGRLVLHGWFTQPSPFFSGSLKEEEGTDALNDVLDKIYDGLSRLRAPLVGTMCLRIVVADDAVVDVEVLTNTVIERIPCDGKDQKGIVEVFELIVGGLFEAEFTGCGSGKITVPFIFQ